MIGALIGIGNTADVYDAGNNKVVKLFKEGYPLDSTRYEFENSKLLNGLAIPIVQSYEVVTYEGRHGIVYQRIDGESMLEALLRTEDLEKYTTALALLHQKILACKLRSAVSLKSILQRNIEQAELSLQAKSKLVTVLEALPDGEHLCHGDYHFGNIIVGQEQNYIIDYMNVCRGHAYGDIARTVYLTEMTPAPAGIDDVDRMFVMKKQAADCYLTGMGVDRGSLSDWLLVTAAARLPELSSEQTVERNSVLEYLSRHGVFV